LQKQEEDSKSKSGGFIFCCPSKNEGKRMRLAKMRSTPASDQSYDVQNEEHGIVI
jgi:hypothetical protein